MSWYFYWGTTSILGGYCVAKCFVGNYRHRHNDNNDNNNNDNTNRNDQKSKARQTISQLVSDNCEKANEKKKESLSYFEAVAKYKQPQLLPKKQQRSLSKDIVHNNNIHEKKNDTKM